MSPFLQLTHLLASNAHLERKNMSTEIDQLIYKMVVIRHPYLHLFTQNKATLENCALLI